MSGPMQPESSHTNNPKQALSASDFARKNYSRKSKKLNAVVVNNNRDNNNNNNNNNNTTNNQAVSSCAEYVIRHPRSPLYNQSINQSINHQPIKYIQSIYTICSTEYVPCTLTLTLTRRARAQASHIEPKPSPRRPTLHTDITELIRSTP